MLLIIKYIFFFSVLTIMVHCRKYLHQALAEYFLGKWSDGVKKPYVDHKTGKDSEAERFVAKQPFVFSDKGGHTVYNLRKMSELPYNLIKVNKTVGT